MALGMDSLRRITRQWVERAHWLLGALTSYEQELLVVATISSPPARAIIAQFREAGAVTRLTAKPYRPSHAIEENTFLRLLSIGVIQQPTRGRYYLDERSLEALEREVRLPLS